MAIIKRIRICKTWHVDVTPEYGDTDASLKAKALEAFDASAKPDGVLVTLMPDAPQEAAQ